MTEGSTIPSADTPPAGIPPELLLLTKAMKVLVVDDSRTLRRFLIRELNCIGITNISEATNGNEAIEKARAEPFDLMLLDMEILRTIK